VYPSKLIDEGINFGGNENVSTEDFNETDSIQNMGKARIITQTPNAKYIII
tara:strand:+ start:32 stop:184 length:153 start_codon:yes stop_codon:yes gene_type:complete